MNAAAIVLIYCGMLAFDAAVLGGTVYLIAERGWSAWWMLAAVIICAGSNPRRPIDAVRGTPVTDGVAPTPKEGE
jgi:hypothetical protein